MGSTSPLSKYSFSTSSLDSNASDLGDAATEHTIMAADQSTPFRRDSINSYALSPASEPKWEGHRRASFTTINPSRHEHTTSSYDAAAAATIMPTNAEWSFTNPTTTASPLSLAHYPPADDYDVRDYVHHPPNDAMSRRNTAPTTYADVSGEGGSIQSPRSTESGHDHMELTAASLDRATGLPRHMRNAHKSSRPVPSRASSDGVRKKNTRIDIPSERNLRNIDELIEGANDEDQVKELKAQRRLLRNREAALASRQRKKQHTEALELKEQDYIKRISSLQNQVHELFHIRATMAQQLDTAQARYMETCHALSASELQREELIMNHSRETGRLRQQLHYYKDQVSSIDPRGEFVNIESEDNLGAFTSDMGALSVDTRSLGVPVEQAANTSTAYGHYQGERPAPTDIRPIKKEPEQPVPSGILFMILLCGAYVASKANVSSLPHIPDEVRVASTTVLDNLLQDPAADAFASHNGNVPSMVPLGGATAQHRHSMDAWGSGIQSAGRPTVNRAMTMPTNDQSAEIFSVTPAEYASLTSPEGYVGHATQSAPKRNLAQTLANLRQESMTGANAAEVYSRSLLWDQIPVDVIRQFKEMIKERKDTALADMPVEHQTKHEFPDNNMWSFHMDTASYHRQED